MTRNLMHAARLLVAAALVARTAAAQPGRDSLRADSAARRLKPVTVTETRSAAVVGGASAIVIRPENLRASPAPGLDQVLRESPFVHVRQNSRGETELSVRGSDSRQAAVLVDGVPMTLGWDHRADPSLIPMTGAERILIVPGLGSLLNGPNTLGGTIAISQDPAAATAGARSVSAGLGVDEVSAFVATLGASRTVAARGGTLTLRGGLSHRDRDGVTLPGRVADPTAFGGLRTNSDLRETDAFASARWRNRSGQSFGVTVTGFDAVRGVPPEEHLAEPRFWRYPANTRTVTAVSAGSGPFSTPFGIGTIEVGGGYNSGRVTVLSYADRSYTSVNGEELGDERTATGRAKFTHSLPGGATFAAALTLADVSYRETLTPAAAVRYRQRLSSAGAEVDVPVGARTTASTGLVFDRATTPETGGRTPGQEAFDDFGWRAGIAHEMSAAWRVHASMSRRSRFPSLRELYSGALNRFRPNPDLKPESLLGLEGGFTVHRSLGAIPDATLQVTAFHHALDDAVVRVTLANPTRFMRVNRDRIESAGAEMMAGLVFGSTRDRSFTLTGDALLQSIRVVDRSANDAARHSENNPGVRGSLALGVPLPRLSRANVGARYTGRQYCLNPETQREMVLTAQAVSDVSIERSFSFVRRGPFRTLRALLSLDNVGNSVVYDQCGLPQAGRTLRVMMTVR